MSENPWLRYLKKLKPYNIQKGLRYLKHSFLKPLEWIGSHTLIIYMLHQPVLYGLFTLILNTNG